MRWMDKQKNRTSKERKRMPRQHVQMYMIVKTPRGLVRIDKDGNETPIAPPQKSPKKIGGKRKKK